VLVRVYVFCIAFGKVSALVLVMNIDLVKLSVVKYYWSSKLVFFP
jgi:hypothetical protein